ncbi:MAG: DUF1330 domain-containing protein [Candidatus Rokuibacteriota bacterium]
MAAYFVVDLDVTDATGFEEYRRAVPPVIAKYGGRFLVRGGTVEALEGRWKPKRLTVVEFPSAARAKEFYNSPEYQQIIGLRLKAASSNLVLVEGV